MTIGRVVVFVVLALGWLAKGDGLTDLARTKAYDCGKDSPIGPPNPTPANPILKRLLVIDIASANCALVSAS